MNTVYCYDRFSTHKRLAAAALLSVAGVGASFAFTGSAEAAARVEQLPRVVVSGKAMKVATLPRVVVAGQRTPEATMLASSGQFRQVSLETLPAARKSTGL